MATFPSAKWFETARARANEDDAFRRLGTADARFGVKVGDEVATVTLDAFEVTAIGTAAADDLRELDFTLDMPAAQWRTYLAGLRGGKQPRQYLTDLDVTTPGGIVRGNPRNRLLLPRYHATIERFFELGAA